MKIRLILWSFLITNISVAQIWSDPDTLYGNEWIDYSQTYYKIKVARDGVYRIPYQTLVAAALPVGSATGDQFRLYRNGRQVRLYLTTNGLLGDQDYLEFVGQKNRDELDQHLFEDPDNENLNPWYSLFNDTAAYYLVLETSSIPRRYTEVPNDLSNAPPKEPYCWSRFGYAYNNALFKRRISNEVKYSWFNGEGFSTYAQSDFSANLPSRKFFNNGPDALLTVRYACDLGNHEQVLSLNDSILASDQFFNWAIRHHEIPVPSSTLQTINKFRLASSLGSNDRNAIAGIYIRYPRLFDFENNTTAEFWLDAGATDRYLEITAFNAGGSEPILYDLQNGNRLECTLDGGLVKVVLPNSTDGHHVWMANRSSGIIQVNELSAVQFQDFSGVDANYVILSNPALYDGPAGDNPVDDYAAYRNSLAGGGYRVRTVDINQLYEQFSYGVRFHPLAIRNFVQYIHKNWPNPEYLLIIGKGLDYDRFRKTSAQTTLADSLFFVPTYGSPGADQLLVMDQKKLSEPLMAIGRLAVTDPTEIRAYLDKVKEHEATRQSVAQTLEDKAWMKRVIHNSGGLANESAAIRAYTQGMADEISQNRVGADVYTYYKTSNDPIQLSSYEQMLDLIDEGVSVWMIFGHSSPNAVDFDIGTPSVYNNQGRYPFMMIMGCFSGLCSAPQQGIGEQFLLAPDRGAIAYFASVNFSFSDALFSFGNKYYERMGGEDYGSTIGKIFSNTIRDLHNTNYPALIALSHQNLLQGDPALRLHHFTGPDYLIDPESVRLEPNPISVEQDVVDITFDIVNIGENQPNELPILVQQQLPDDNMLLRKSDTLATAGYRQTVQYPLATSGSQVGLNRFLIDLDPNEQVLELPPSAKFNNQLTDDSGKPGVGVFFYADDLAPVYPPAFGIVDTAPVTLLASTLNALANPGTYLFEIDTLESFSSPFKQQASLQQAGGLLEVETSS